MLVNSTSSPRRHEFGKSISHQKKHSKIEHEVMYIYLYTSPKSLCQEAKKQPTKTNALILRKANAFKSNFDGAKSDAQDPFEQLGVTVQKNPKQILRVIVFILLNNVA